MLTLIEGWLLQTEAFGLWAMILVSAASFLLRKLRAPHRICSALWLIVLFCYTCPFGIPVQMQAASAYSIPAAAPADITAAAANTANRLVHTAAEAAPQKAGALSLGVLLMLCWAGGALFLLLKSICEVRRLCRKTAAAYRETDASGTVYFTGETVPTAFVTGAFRPRIYLPLNLAEPEKHYILLHEKAHLARHDEVWRPLFYFVACLHWFDPLVWLAYAQMINDSEAACDEAVLHCIGAGEKSAYGRSLLHFALRGTAPFRPAFGEGRTKMRIKNILHYRKGGVLAVSGCMVLACIVGGACLLRPVSAEAAGASEMASQAETASSAVSTPDSAAVSDSASNSEAASAAANGEALPNSAAESPALPDSASSEANGFAVSSQPAVSNTEPAPAANADATAPTPNGIAFVRPMDAAWPISRYMENGHKGCDIAAEKGTPIYAMADGTVTTAEYEETQGYGYWVILDHGNGWKTCYAHCATLLVQAGQTVKAGDEIATVGNTGRSTGNHCHVEILYDADGTETRYSLTDWFAQ